MGTSEQTVLAVLLVALTATGCASNSVEDRLASDIRQLRQATAAGPGPSWLASMSNRYLLDALSHLGSRDLREPHLVVPILGVKSNDTILVVLWVEDNPSVTGIELHGGNEGSHVLQIPGEYTIQNEEDAKRSVIFRAVYRWPREDIPSLLRAPCGVRLIAPHASTNITSVVIHRVR